MRTSNKGGRPAKHGWDGFWHEVVRIANTPDGLPDRAELQRRMMDWCGEYWDEPPAESAVRGKLAALYSA